MSSRVRARVEPSLGARVIARTPLLYRDGAQAGLDRPAHVRAGSALARLDASTLAVVQDDASFVAIVSGVGSKDLVVHDVPLPSASGVRQFDDARGNKKAKLDLEACLVVDGGALLIAFGSGSSAARERVALVEHPASGTPRVVVVEARDLYASMRSEPVFCGSELNVEGAALVDGAADASGNGPGARADVIFLQRGNGAPCDDLQPLDASARVDRALLVAYLRALARGETAACPPLRDVVAWDLGDVNGTRLTFTDAVATRGRSTAFLACAEDSPDATCDGPVRGVVIGRLDDRARVAELGVVLDERGAPLLDKAEGITLDEGAQRAWVVIDRDDATRPAELLELRLGERWKSDE